jgi:hypothetical protein
MSKSKSASRKLDPYRVQMAQRLQAKKHELAMEMVADRVRKDAEFAADVLKIAGDTLREDIKKDALETIAKEQALKEGFDKSIVPDKLTAVPVNVPIEVVDVPKEQLVEALSKLSEQQAQRLQAAELLKAADSGEQCGGDGCLCQNH